MDLWPKYMNNKIIFKSSFLLLQIPTDRHQCMKLWFHLWYLKEQSHSENIKLLLLFVVVASTDALHAGLWPCGPLRTPADPAAAQWLCSAGGVTVAQQEQSDLPPEEWRGQKDGPADRGGSMLSAHTQKVSRAVQTLLHLDATAGGHARSQTHGA